MSVDLSKIKPGDEVTVRGVVTVVNKGITVQFPNSALGAELWVPDLDIVSHTPKTLSVGDRVKGRDFGSRMTGQVLALDGPDAWVAWSETLYEPSRRETWALSDLERLP